MTKINIADGVVAMLMFSQTRKSHVGIFSWAIHMSTTSMVTFKATLHEGLNGLAAFTANC